LNKSNNFLGALNKNKVKINDCGISPDDFAVLSKLLYTGVIDKKQFMEIIDKRINQCKQSKNSFFADEIDFSQIKRVSSAYPDRIIEEFKSE
jgi:Asp-tRNA(Asn)/Glu-tRNA(Gln) amidotransferase B subunit